MMSLAIPNIQLIV
ncbi:hypothetical protein F383_37572 [Gossypium arboreum]|uniref:Uncharacterized protein n=1 Tax=Gossypium arboreum TaxID=29729 RepID=A0A0B0MC56_GOSAR|nr:hypothetical protein F383_37572 [Gossypium arboreum]